MWGDLSIRRGPEKLGKLLGHPQELEDLALVEANLLLQVHLVANGVNLGGGPAGFTDHGVSPFICSRMVLAKLVGGGVPGQAGAVSLGIARALLQVNPEFRVLLKRQGLLTRDPRMKERKKYGLKGARRAFQYSKR